MRGGYSWHGSNLRRRAVVEVKAKKKSQKVAQWFEAERKSPVFGAEIHGLDLKQPADKDTYRRLEDALIEYKVIFVRDQFLDIYQHMEVGRQLGTLEIHPFTKNHPDHPEVIMLEYDENNPPGGADVWHSDATFRERPTNYTTLRCEVIPELGGDTVFADMQAVYEGLSDHIKLLIDGLEAVHDYPHHRAKFIHTDEGRKHLAAMEKKFPNPTHPLVRDHPVTGKPALYVNPAFTQRIVGMKQGESRAILDLLFEQVHAPECQFRVKWAPGMITFWDNASVQHYASNDFYPHHRRMYRVSTEGGRPFHKRVFECRPIAAEV